MINSTKIKVGVLTPYSSIYPHLIASFVNGFYCSMPEKYQYEFEFIPEYIGQGSQRVTKDAVGKLLNFNNVDIISGLVSYKSLPDIIPMIESRNKLAFFFDMGEYLPFTSLISNSVFTNSFQLWQSEYALGYWAHKKFGDKGLVSMPLYDSGYHLHSAFRQGTISAGSQLIDFNVLPYIEGQSQVKSQIQLLFEQIKKESPAYIHAIYCGTEAVEFISEFHKSGLAGKIPLIVSAHMASEEILSQVHNLNMTIYSASMWDFNNELEINKIFKARYFKQTGNKANIFALLGYEMGMAFYELLPEIRKKEWGVVIKRLKSATVKSPRGERNFHLNSEYATPLINIEKIEIGNNTVRKLVIEQGRSLAYNHTVFEEIHTENVTGWQNPYLCV